MRPLPRSAGGLRAVGAKAASYTHAGSNQPLNRVVTFSMRNSIQRRFSGLSVSSQPGFEHGETLHPALASRSSPQTQGPTPSCASWQKARRCGAALLLICASATAHSQGMGAPGPTVGSGSGGSSTIGPAGGSTTAPALPGVPTINNTSPTDASRLQQQQQNAAPDMAPEVKADLGAGTLREPLEENEFQRFVFNATGQKLGLFAQRYFDNAAQRTYAPIDRVPVPADYVLGPGDELYIR
ncbi:MAG: hypothetical protein RL375_1888, partial [Pseudomonadota bacterium]